FVAASVALPFVGEASVATAVGLVVVGVAGTAGGVPGVSRTVGAWLVLVCLLVLSRHRRNIRGWWIRQYRDPG
ncbi:MAG: hypothetical protein ACRCYX_13675, partial [Dermatophilaceae bacterium]